MACRVRYLNSAGIMRREIKGIDALSNVFPPHWLLYVSLNCFPRGQDPMEIDALVVMEDRVLVLEIKDWNGVLSHQNDKWYIGNQSRGRSAVIQVSEKAKKLKAVLRSELNQVGSQVWVDYRVVLTGSATKQHLHQNEQPYVWSLTEACAVADPIKRQQALSPTKLKLVKLCTLGHEFDRVVGNTKIFQASEADWSGYRITEQSLFSHPRGIWTDHRGERRGESRFKALIRTWAFDKLPVGLNSPDRRQLIALRETKAFAYIQENDNELIRQNRLLREAAPPPDEIATNHFEVREIFQGWSTLDRYLEKYRDDLSLDDRLLVVSNLLTLVSRLHRCAVSHRDLGPRSIWLGSPTDVALTGFMSCQLPDQESVFDWLSTLRGYAPPLPEDQSPSSKSTGRQRDVYLCAYLAAFVLTGTRPENAKTSLQLPAELSFLTEWFHKGLAELPQERYSDATEMAEEFSRLVEDTKQVRIDQSLLDRFETAMIPYQRWLTKKTLSQKPSRAVYLSEDPQGKAVVVKVWNNISRGQKPSIDLALLSLFESVSRLRGTPVDGLPRFEEVGLSPIGPYVVYEYFDGIPLSELPPKGEIDALQISIDLLTTVAALHTLGCAHGDISSTNVLFDPSTGKLRIIDLFDIPAIGDVHVNTPAFCPPNWEQLSNECLDRYAALKIVNDYLASQNSSIVTTASGIIADELQRPIIESLELPLSTLKRALQQLTEDVPRFTLATQKPMKEFSAGRGFYLRREQHSDGIELFFVTNETGQLVIEGDGRHVTSHRTQTPHFPALAHESTVADHFDFELRLTTAHTESGFDPLYRYLRGELAEKSAEPEVQPAESTFIAFDTARHWRRLMALEDADRIEVELTRLIGADENTAIFQYENDGSDFDFDPDDTVDVFTETNRRVGELDHTLSRLPGTIAIRGDTRAIAPGDRVRLSERRSQASIDRRMRAVDRILEKRSVIPDLISYFYPHKQVEPTRFTVEVPEEALAEYRLNEGQKAAFRTLLHLGPVGLLQGPPGTGKTRFIASFVHWLLTSGTGQRVLIASQSHEAVNNAIDSILQLYKRLGGRPYLLRIGSKGITERIRPYHSSELRERYRVRFEAAAKYRYMQLTSAKGIARKFAGELFDLERELGVLLRRIKAVETVISEQGDVLSVERERNLSHFTRLKKAFADAASRKFDREFPPDEQPEFVELAREVAGKHPDISEADVNAALRLLELTEDWLSSLASPQRNFEEFLAKTRNIVTATCVGVGQTRIRIDSQVFDWVIVDEAARCTPGELAVPIQMAKRVLLVGDHLQLKPMLSRALAAQLEEEDPTTERDVLLSSDFERAFNSSYGKAVGVRFTEQYRMDDAICRMVSRCFYEPHNVRLRTSGDRAPSVVAGINDMWPPHPLTWVDTSNHQSEREIRPRDSTSRYNQAEIEATILALERLSNNVELVEHLSCSDNETPIGVICMYADQKRHIDLAFAKHAWQPAFRKLVRVDTVDSYQGKENEIVILSLVCSNDHRDMGHVGSPNRCNVAVSRAKDRLVIIGSVRMWQLVPESAPMRTVLTYMKADPDSSIVDMRALQ